VSVALCIVTLFRPEGLGNLLEGIRRLDVGPEGNLDLSVIVVDNDENGSARPVVERAAATLEWPVRYVIEPVRGIPHARNRAVAEAGEVDLLAFIDDDEVPEPDWLRVVLEVRQRAGATVVLGPSLPRFDEAPPAWIVRGGFFERTRFTTGEVIPSYYARTSGVLIERAALGPDAFDVRFRYTGFEDTEFFSRVASRGGRIVWADEARVIETVPASRANLRWLLLRSYRNGACRSITLTVIDRAPLLRRLKRVIAGLSTIVAGVVTAAVGVVRGRAGVARGLQGAAYGSGLIGGLVGLGHDEYRVIHGR